MLLVIISKNVHQMYKKRGRRFSGKLIPPMNANDTIAISIFGTQIPTNSLHRY